MDAGVLRDDDHLTFAPIRRLIDRDNSQVELRLTRAEIEADVGGQQ